jgi:NADP-dependent 3-hydroxy acid dehydrogenase YdfG
VIRWTQPRHLIRCPIDAAIKAAEKKIGGIDVLVNNAGIGYFAAIEEGEESEVMRMFEINVFGLSRMIRAAMPGMRLLGKGFIVNFSSIAGPCAFPATGYYNATNFAVGVRVPVPWTCRVGENT